MKKCVVAGTIFCIALVSGCVKKTEEAQPATDRKVTVKQVEIKRVEAQNIRRRLRVSGVARGAHEAWVISQTQGMIEKVAFSLGDYVGKGKLLVKVNDVIQKAAFLQAQKQYELARMNEAVVEKLYKEQNASEAEMTNARSSRAGAQAGYESALKTLQDCSIDAPIAGFIATRADGIEAGNLINGGKMIGRIVDISSLKVEVVVGEEDVVICKPGLEATIVVPALNNKEFSGTVKAVGAGADPATGSFPVEIGWKNTEDRAVKSGMSVEIALETIEPQKVVLVPLETVVKRENTSAVFIEENGRAVLRFLTTGTIVRNTIEVLDGVNEGDRLVVSGFSTLGAGDSLSVTVLEPDNGGANEHR